MPRKRIKTGLALLTLQDSAPALRLRTLLLGASDSAIITAAGQVHKMGVDVPLGWPQPFLQLIAAHNSWSTDSLSESNKAWRSQFVYRSTDLWVREHFGLRPLSVSADLIAHPALRWVSIESQLRAHQIGCARDGSQRICEVYPAGALHQWGINNRGYKGTSVAAAGRREAIVAALEARITCDWGDKRALLLRSDDALDAVLAALVAACVHAGHAYGPPEALGDVAAREGWLWLPHAPATP